MLVDRTVRWTEEAEVVVVGYGGAGAIAAITAHDAGSKVLILEKQASDLPGQTRHTPNTRMSGGAWFGATGAEKAALYLSGMVAVASEALDAERKEMIHVVARYLTDNTEWMMRIGVNLADDEEIVSTLSALLKEELEVKNGKIFSAEYPELPGSECSCLAFTRAAGKYRDGAALFKGLSDAVSRRGIQVMWETQATHLLTHRGEVWGVKARQNGKEVAIKANRAVLLTCGGFEFDEWMKENYLRVNPAYFYGNPGNTGDGIRMAMEAGASLWHMNNASWRVTMKFLDFPIAFGTQHHSSSVIVDKRGKRFTNERFRIHTFGYELTNYDSYALCYPKVPCYWIFDEKRRSLGPVASLHGPCNPPGGVMGDAYYVWSPDNQAEIDRGWIMRTNTIEDLAKKLGADPDNHGLMNPDTLRDTFKQYNQYCRKGEDLDFRKPREWLIPLEDPPYYAVKLWPGGPNTQGGPKRNAKGQVLRVDNTPIPRLYSAGEMGSFWGMVYHGGGNLAECIAFGRIAGANAAAEKRRK